MLQRYLSYSSYKTWFARLSALILGSLPFTGCAPEPAVDEPELPGSELRTRLGIPKAARRIVLFGQTAHLDVGWQKTFDGYYQSAVKDIFQEASQLLEQQPRAFYSVAEMAYLKHHLALHPEQTSRLRSLADRQALRIVGGGVTSPDTLLPETELLLRDYLYGSLFSEGTLGARPRAAWLPDSFGHAATVPDLLSAAGFDSVAFGRVDGAPTIFEAVVQLKTTPRAGSSAELLQKLGSADFIWRGPGGGKVLGHYLSANLYCTGDNIDYDEAITPAEKHMGPFRGDDPDYTDGMIDSYVAALTPYARTPFLFVPVGCDFQHPKPRLLEYLDGYNQRHYEQTGTFVTVATFEDYAQLVLPYRDRLPELAADPTPYFTGFYASRADIKERVRAAARPFFTAETFTAALLPDADSAALPWAPALEELTRSNHHDFITGTANDAVVATEQLPLLDRAEQAGRRAQSQVAAALAARIPSTPGAVGRVLLLNPVASARSGVAEVTVAFAPPLAALKLHAAIGKTAIPLEILGATPAGAGYSAVQLRLAVDELPPLAFRAVDLFPGESPVGPQVALQLLDEKGMPATGTRVARVILSGKHVLAQWSRTPAQGFALTSVKLDGSQALAAPSFILSEYTDQGGLWRLGHEMDGCSLTLTPPGTPPGPDDKDAERVEILQHTGLAVAVAFHSRQGTREARLDAGDRGLQLALTTAAASGTSRSATFSFAVPDGAPLRTAQAGGFAERVWQRIYSPTFWPAVTWLSSGPWAVLLTQSTGVRFGQRGEVELLTVRNAEVERCDIAGGQGTDPGTHRITWRLQQSATPVQAEQAAQLHNRPVVAYPIAPDAVAAPTPDLPAERSLLQLHGSGVLSALKPAERGTGVILRALLLPGPLTISLPPALIGKRLYAVDAAERDLRDLGIAPPQLTLDREHFGAIATVRLR